jgi:hypothetical protein
MKKIFTLFIYILLQAIYLPAQNGVAEQPEINSPELEFQRLANCIQRLYPDRLITETLPYGHEGRSINNVKL